MGGAVRDICEEFRKMGLEMIEDGVQVVYKPSAEDEKRCYEFGREFANRIKEYHKTYQ
jgi:flavorubredoxin